MRFNRMTTALLSVFVLLSAEIPVRAQNPPPVFNPPKRYYLALGDSIAYGFQSFKFAANLPPAAYNTGYVDVFGARLRQIWPGITTVNFGCPGESTETFVGGHCIWTETGHEGCLSESRTMPVICTTHFPAVNCRLPSCFWKRIQDK